MLTSAASLGQVRGVWSDGNILASVATDCRLYAWNIADPARVHCVHSSLLKLTNILSMDCAAIYSDHSDQRVHSISVVGDGVQEIPLQLFNNSMQLNTNVDKRL